MTTNGPLSDADLTQPATTTPRGCQDGWLEAGSDLGCVMFLPDQPAIPHQVSLLPVPSPGQAAREACKEVDGFLVEPVTKEKEDNLEDMAEVGNIKNDLSYILSSCSDSRQHHSWRSEVLVAWAGEEWPRGETTLRRTVHMLYSAA